MTIETISFEEDARLMSEFLQLLEREQKSLITNNVAEIELIVSDKTALLQHMNEVAKKRYALLAERHFEANENGMVAWVIDCADAKLKKRWDAFQLQLSKAKEINRINGMLINKHFNRNRQILQGLQNAVKSNETYGRNGQTNTTITSRGSVVA